VNIDTIAAPTIAVDFGTSLQGMIAAGKYDWVSPNITAGKFPVEGTGKKTFRTKLFHFGRNISSNDAVAAMRSEGFTPASPRPRIRRGVPRGATRVFHRLSRLVRPGARHPLRRVPQQLRSR
jgi:hypothetical protein